VEGEKGKMSIQAARKMQKLLWHTRWLLLVGIMLYNFYSFFSTLHLDQYLCVHGFGFAMYFFLGLLAGYFECKGSCKQRYD
jgi:ABC-type multidrug transport system permease subunit